LESWHQHLDKDKLLGNSCEIFIQIHPKTTINNNIVIIKFGDEIWTLNLRVTSEELASSCYFKKKSNSFEFNLHNKSYMVVTFFTFCFNRQSRAKPLPDIVIRSMDIYVIQ
jgi:hypothetical protein